MPYGNGSTKASHYKPLSYDGRQKVQDAKRRARKESPLPLPRADLGPAKVKPNPSKALNYSLATDPDRRDRNW